jgi:Protein of unknown function (DUF3450)
VIRIRMRTLLPVAAVVFAAPALAQNQAEDPGSRYAQAVADTESFQRFNRQIEEQVRSQEEEIASIERQLVEIDFTNRAVQPLMQRMVDTLARFIELDLPFLREERAATVQELQDVMGRADVSISEKYRMILEAYQNELEYGQTVQAYNGRLGTGADARTVEFARIGRVTLMYRTLDGVETGYWDADQDMWVVDPRYHDAVEEALRVAKEDGAPELLTVPVPAPQEVRS